MGRRPSCPVCRSPLIRIVFGLPPYELFLAEQRGELKLGGCCLPVYAPQGWCPTCGAQRGFDCPVCGYGRLPDAPWDDEGRPMGHPCPCCGTRFGIDTAGPEDLQAHRTLRRKWLRAGCPWWSTEQAPPRRWDPQRQVAGIREPGPGWD